MKNWRGRRHFTFYFILSELWLVQSLKVFEHIRHTTTLISRCFVIAINHPELVDKQFTKPTPCCWACEASQLICSSQVNQWSHSWAPALSLSTANDDNWIMVLSPLVVPSFVHQNPTYWPRELTTSPTLHWQFTQKRSVLVLPTNDSTVAQRYSPSSGRLSSSCPPLNS